MNTCALVGILERAPTVIESEGPLQARFTLRVEETGKDGKVYPLFVSCEAFGPLAARASSWEAETVLSLVGKLKWRSVTDKQGQKSGGLCVCQRGVYSRIGRRPGRVKRSD